MTKEFWKWWRCCCLPCLLHWVCLVSCGLFGRIRLRRFLVVLRQSLSFLPLLSLVCVVSLGDFERCFFLMLLVFLLVFLLFWHYSVTSYMGYMNIILILWRMSILCCFMLWLSPLCLSHGDRHFRIKENPRKIKSVGLIHFSLD